MKKTYVPIVDDSHLNFEAAWKKLKSDEDPKVLARKLWDTQQKTIDLLVAGIVAWKTMFSPVSSERNKGLPIHEELQRRRNETFQ